MSEQRKGKIRYFQNYFEKNKTNMKMLWTGIRSIVNVKFKTQFSNISHFLDNGTRVNDLVKMANLFNPSCTKSFGTHALYQRGSACYLKNRCPHEREIL